MRAIIDNRIRIALWSWLVMAAFCSVFVPLLSMPIPFWNGMAIAVTYTCVLAFGTVGLLLTRPGRFLLTSAGVFVLVMTAISYGFIQAEGSLEVLRVVLYGCYVFLALLALTSIYGWTAAAACRVGRS